MRVKKLYPGRALFGGRVPTLSVAAVTLAAATVGIAAQSGAAHTLNARAKAAASGLAAAKAAIAEYEKHPKFVAPGPKFNATKDSGKTVWVVPDISSVPVVTQVENGLKSALSVARVRSSIETTNGTVTQWVSGMNTAISQRAAAIIDIGIEPSSITAELAKAAAAHIPVIYVFSVQGAKVAKNVAGNVPINYGLYAQLLADKAVIDTNGHAQAAIVYTNQLPQDVPAIATIKHVFSTICPGCSVATTQDIQEANWATQTTSDTGSILTSNPNVNVLIPLHDALAEYMIPALRSSNKIGTIKVETHDGTASAIQEIKSGAITSDLGWSNAWVGWATADQVLRALAGKPTLKTENVGNVLFDSKNAKNLTTQAAVNKYFGTSFVSGYKALWGISK